jgi:hypothetical protein
MSEALTIDRSASVRRAQHSSPTQQHHADSDRSNKSRISHHHSFAAKDRPAAVFLFFTLLTACAGPRWTASGLLLDADKLVAEAIGDPPREEQFDASLVPRIAAPTSLRPCCALGMDLHLRYIGIPIPGYAISNITDLPTLGQHEYDHGTIALQSNGHFIGLEKNGIVYTCRGGFVDIAHVRDTADMTFFIATRLLAALPGALDLDFATTDATEHVRVAVPAKIMRQHGRFAIAAIIATWLAYQQGSWHEVAQWWGYSFNSGYSEQASAFSPEDFYSNALGARLGGLSIAYKVFRTRDDYNRGMDAWLKAALEALIVVPTETARAAMHGADGVWWDSHFDLPANASVPRRRFDIDNPITPWRLEDMQAPERVPPMVGATCAGASPRSLTITSEIDGVAIASFASLEWTPRDWAHADFPFTTPSARRVSSSDLPRIVALTHEAMRPSFAPCFDRPAAAACAPE